MYTHICIIASENKILVLHQFFHLLERRIAYLIMGLHLRKDATLKIISYP